MAEAYSYDIESVKQMKFYRYSFGKKNEYSAEFKLYPETDSVWTATLNEKAEKAFEENKNEYSRILSTVKECMKDFAEDGVDELGSNDVEEIHFGFKIERKHSEEKKNLCKKKVFSPLSVYKFSKSEEYSKPMNKFIVTIEKD